MKKTALDKIPVALPPEFERLLAGAPVYDSSCSPEARVYFIDKDSDYCLPNILLDNWRFSGFVDVGNGGVGDRQIDVFWGVWTLWFNLHTNQYRDRFLDAYGRDKVDESVLKVVAAAEVFG